MKKPITLDELYHPPSTSRDLVQQNLKLKTQLNKANLLINEITNLLVNTETNILAIKRLLLKI